MHVTYYAHARDTSPSSDTPTWSEWADQVQAIGHLVIQRPEPCPEGWEAQAKLSCPAYSPGEIPPGLPRADASVTALHFGVLDFDAINPLELELVRANLQTHGLAALIYTTWKHTAGPNPRVRVVVPFGHPFPSDRAWPGLYGRLAAFVGCGLRYDTTCKNPSRIFFWPSCPSDRAADAWIERYEGRSITREDLASIQLDTPDARAQAIPAQGSRKITRAEIEALRDKAKRSQKPSRRLVGASLAAVLSGGPWAIEGERDEILHQTCLALALEFPTLDAEHVASHFSLSCAAMGADFPVSLVVQKLENARRWVADQALEAEAEALRDHEIRISTSTLGQRTHPYTPEELAAWCRAEGCTVEQAGRRWVLRQGDDVFLWVPTRGYVGPYGRGSGTDAAHQHLVAAEPVGVSLQELTDRGLRKRAISEISADYGTVLDAVEIDLTAPLSRYETATNSLIEAPCPLRQIAPEYHPSVDAWLRALGGDDYEVLAQWIAWVTHLGQPCTALFLEGTASAGKNMLAHGLARLWTTAGPTSAAEALADFNSAICSCPLIFADEQLPRGFSGRGKTAEIRDLIGSTSHQIKRKYRPATRAKGAIRLIVAANNRNILSGERDLSDDDVQAIQKRFLYVRVGEEAKSVLEGWNTYAENWVDGDVIARHAVWLRDQIPLPVHPPRFLISQSGDNVLSQTMATASHSGGQVANWLVRYLLEPQKLETQAIEANRHVRVWDGALYCSSRAIAEGWRPYFDDRPPSVNSVGGALRALSEGAKDFKVAGQGWRQRMRRIDTRAIVAWAEDRGYASREQIEAAIKVLEIKHEKAQALETN